MTLIKYFLITSWKLITLLFAMIFSTHNSYLTLKFQLPIIQLATVPIRVQQRWPSAHIQHNAAAANTATALRRAE